MRHETMTQLIKFGIYINQGPLESNHLFLGSAMMPVCMIWHESVDPREEEMSILGEFVDEQLKNFSKVDKKHFKVLGANTPTFYKRAERLWTYRKLVWPEFCPLWYPHSYDLEKIIRMSLRSNQQATT